MTAKTLEKSSMFVHPLSEGIYSVDDLSTSLTVFPGGDAPVHYEHMSAGKRAVRPLGVSGAPAPPPVPQTPRGRCLSLGLPCAI